jgi:hypothetical protein
MAFLFASGTIATLTVAGTDLSGALEDIKLDRKAKDERHHVLGSNPVVTLVHAAEFTMTLKGLIDPAVSTLFSSNLGPPAPTVQCVYEPQGPGGPVRTFDAFVTDFSENTAGDKTGTFDATLAVNGVIVDS